MPNLSLPVSVTKYVSPKFIANCALLSIKNTILGFDAHKDDPLAQLQLKSDDYHIIAKRTLSVAKECCDGKIVSILEGRYDLNVLKESTEGHVGALLEFN